MSKISIKKQLGLLGLSLLSAPVLAGSELEAAASEGSFLDNELNLILLIAAVAQFLVLLSLGYIINKVVAEKGLWINKNKLLGFLIIVSLFGGNQAMAGTETQELVEAPLFDSVTYLLLSINVVLLFLVVYLKRLSGQVLVIATGIVPKEKSFSVDLTGLVPIEEEADIMTDHEYDGIRELDNNMPPWWIGLFYLSIIFAVVYIPYYHFSDAGQLQEEEYITEMAEAEAEIAAVMERRGNMVDETNVKLLTTDKAMKSGAKVFKSMCAACHGQSGEGQIGPNLTDRYWLHGGDIKEVFYSIKYGIPTKGMKSWKDDLTPAQMAETASYILSLQGSNPANAKAPQGDLVE